METKITLSVCTIVKNEEKQIKSFLSALDKFADEIILVDTGSSDKTIEIVEALASQNDHIKLKRFHTEGSFHYGKAKNFAINQATQDFIIILDADERLSASFKEGIRQFLGEKNPDVVTIRRFDEYVRHLSDLSERVIKNNKKIFYKTTEEGRIHETLDHSYPEVFFPEPVWHCQRWNHYLQRPQRTLFQLEIQIEGIEKTKSFVGHFFRGVWYFFFRFKKLYWGKGLYKDGAVGFKYAFMRAVDAFLVEFFVGLKPSRQKRIYWDNPKYNKEND